MLGRNVSRRLFVGVVGTGVITAPIVASAPVTPASVAEGESAELTMSERIAGLIRPLVVGSRLSKCTLVQIDPLATGAISVKFMAEDQHTFALEIMARDTSPLALKPPAVTEKFAVFVVNGGDGWSRTREEQGLTAMDLAQLIRRNEHAVELPGLLTHAERIRRHADALLASAPGLASS